MPNYNDVNTTLMPVPTSSSFYRFKRNLNSQGWFNRLLDSLFCSKEDSLAWLLHAIAGTHNEESVSVAEGCGFLLNGKKMDVESVVAMWEEANCNLQQQ
jgi:hypothetical protein